ncbi:bifunctional riboflavin kinase/FAD synthetase [Brevibacterium album]|uniref:bifunctional riboflavin kinase/FAD synthetase n=1 Tax=Brevibacterium album TaxID=417948 RepID=UPI0004010EF6|nr:bifunctional riboflavin kinase/FAD synthetase [Brevibacterium album]
MDIFASPEDIPADYGSAAVGIGNFDGVHRGHRVVLSRLAEVAEQRGLKSIAVTFDPHPRAVHRPEAAVEQICSLSQRLALIGGLGIDATVVQQYSLEWADQSAERFVLDYLVRGLRAAVLVVGSDVRFGRDNSGDLATLMRLGAEHGFEVVVIDEVGVGARYSSTSIRRRIEAGDVRGAAEELGYNHALMGEVVHGEKRGREMGFPTANLDIGADGLVPADGVYAGWMTFPARGLRLPTAISVGTNPTFHGHVRTVEGHAIDVEFGDLDVYGETMEVEFVDRIRGQVAFRGMEPLIAQMHADVDRARAVLGLQTPFS